MTTEKQLAARRKFAERFGNASAPERVNVRGSRRARSHTRSHPRMKKTETPWEIGRTVFVPPETWLEQKKRALREANPNLTLANLDGDPISQNEWNRLSFAEAERAVHRALMQQKMAKDLFRAPVKDYMKWTNDEQAYWTPARQAKWHRDNPEGETPPWNA